VLLVLFEMVALVSSPSIAVIEVGGGGWSGGASRGAPAF